MVNKNRFPLSVAARGFTDQVNDVLCAHSSNLCPGASIHARFIKCAVPCSLFLHNHLLNMYVKCGDFDSGHQLFDEMPEWNVVSWSAVILGFVQRGCPEKALLMFRRMRREGTTVPNSFTLVSALHACSLLCETDGHASSLAYQVNGLIVRLGLEWNVFLVNAFLTALIGHGQLVQVFE